MTKLAANRIEGFIRKPDPHIRAVLVYGPDEGLVRERATTLCKTVLPDLTDPFRVAEISSTALSTTPSLLNDEMAALSLIGGRRLVRIRDAAENITSAVSDLLKSPPAGDTLLVIEAGDLDKRSKLRTLFETSEIAVAIPCYVEDEATLERNLADLLATEGLTATPDARVYLARCLVGDRALVRTEIAKLALYMGSKKQVELEDVQACITDGGTSELDLPAWAAADGDAINLDRALEKLFEEDQSPVAILRLAQRHFERLHRVASAVTEGQSLSEAVATLKPPLFFKDQAQFTQQARRWSLPLLSDALGKLVEAEAMCKRTGLPDTAICSRVLHQLAARAKQRV